MKKIILYTFLFFAQYSISQELGSINDIVISNNNSSSFMLLGKSPSSIFTTNDVGKIGLHLLNGESFSVEVNPYWHFWSKKDTSYYNYRGFKKDKGVLKENIFSGLKRSTSISLGYVEDKFDGFNDERKASSLAVRTKLIRFYGKNRRGDINNIIKKVKNFNPQKGMQRTIHELLSRSNDNSGKPILLDVKKCEKFTNDNTIPDYIQQEIKENNYNLQEIKVFRKYLKKNGYPKEVISKFLTKKTVSLIIKDIVENNLKENELEENEIEILKLYIDKNKITTEDVKKYLNSYCNVTTSFYYNTDSIKPIINLDIGTGLGILFYKNNFSSRVTKHSAWSVLQVYPFKKFNLNFSGLIRFTNDGFSKDEQGDFKNENFWDYGGKVSFGIDKLKFSYEYLERNSSIVKYRSVGNVSYQINNKLSIIGGFGKDFELEENLVSFLGLSLGILNKNK